MRSAVFWFVVEVLMFVANLAFFIIGHFWYSGVVAVICAIAAAYWASEIAIEARWRP